MKWIVAMIPPERLDAVQAALEQTDADLAYLGQVLDLRDQTPEMYRGVEYRAGRLKIRLEILVANDIQAEETIGVLATACAGDTKPYGRGQILVLPVEEWMPIRGYEPRFAHAGAAKR